MPARPPNDHVTPDRPATEPAENITANPSIQGGTCDHSTVESTGNVAPPPPTANPNGKGYIVWYTYINCKIFQSQMCLLVLLSVEKLRLSICRRSSTIFWETMFNTFACGVPQTRIQRSWYVLFFYSKTARSPIDHRVN